MFRRSAAASEGEAVFVPLCLAAGSDENARFINFVTKSLPSVVERDRLHGASILMRPRPRLLLGRLLATLAADGNPAACWDYSEPDQQRNRI